MYLILAYVLVGAALAVFMFTSCPNKGAYIAIVLGMSVLWPLVVISVIYYAIRKEAL